MSAQICVTYSNWQHDPILLKLPCACEYWIQLLVESHLLQSELLDSIRVQLRGGLLKQELHIHPIHHVLSKQDGKSYLKWIYSRVSMNSLLSIQLPLFFLVLVSMLFSPSHSAPITDGIREGARSVPNKFIWPRPLLATLLFLSSHSLSGSLGTAGRTLRGRTCPGCTGARGR